MGEKAKQHLFRRQSTPTQSLYALMNNVFTINNSHFPSAVPL